MTRTQSENHDDDGIRVLSVLSPQRPSAATAEKVQNSVLVLQFSQISALYEIHPHFGGQQLV